MRLDIRLTEKHINGFYRVSRDYIKVTKQGYDMSKTDCVDKLGQLEDIEDEIGISLVTLFKALKDGVYFENDKKHHVVALDLGSSGNYRLSYEIIDGLFESVYTKDYGKTWALTKDELK